MRYISILLLFLFTQCSQQTTDGGTVKHLNDKEIQSDNFAGTVEDRLAQMLRRESGVIVSQANGRYAVKVRGLANSFGSSSSPLYVINGTSIGHDFHNAAEAIAGGRISSIRVLKGKDASIYGTRGAGGVVEIKTKTPSFAKE
ncbi:MAG: TonB-dependent SusC/RagA subfamily outer membrane receptor [Saprospiraceae bacterium]|jgi:TonB-dependent SusC/RagA subfamily outer membrane receptor